MDVEESGRRNAEGRLGGRTRCRREKRRKSGMESGLVKIPGVDIVIGILLEETSPPMGPSSSGVHDGVNDVLLSIYLRYRRPQSGESLSLGWLGWLPLNIPQHAFEISAPSDDEYQRTPAEESIHENSNPSFTQSPSRNIFPVTHEATVTHPPITLFRRSFGIRT